MSTPESTGQQQSPVEATDDDLVEADDLVETCEYEGQRRLWIRAIMPLVHGCLSDSEASDKLKDVHEGMQIAAMRRLVRELNSDIAG